MIKELFDNHLVSLVAVFTFGYLNTLQNCLTVTNAIILIISNRFNINLHQFLILLAFSNFISIHSLTLSFQDAVKNGVAAVEVLKFWMSIN